MHTSLGTQLSPQSTSATFPLDASLEFTITFPSPADIALITVNDATNLGQFKVKDVDGPTINPPSPMPLQTTLSEIGFFTQPRGAASFVTFEGAGGAELVGDTMNVTVVYTSESTAVISSP